MELHTLKFGLEIATAFVIGVILLFALYWKMGEAVIRKAKKSGK